VFALGILGGTVHVIFGLLALPFTILIEYLDSKFKCPKCNRPVGLHKYKWGKFKFAMRTACTRKKCDFCGEPFV
jgi:hypothetical protein